MKRALLIAAVGLLFSWTPGHCAESGRQAPGKVALVVHGGTGNLKPEDLSAERDEAMRGALEQALRAGHSILVDGGTALDAVETAIRALEDSPHFNAGKGAVFTAEGKNELDASIMDGARLRAGAVAGVTKIKNPITAARAVMEQTEHVLLAGAGADAFAESIGLETVEPGYFHTERRWKALEERIQREEEGAGASAEVGKGDDSNAHFGTVGAVALDGAGGVAAGTSTGGMTYKRHGRIGDSPIVGAGTYANRSCGVSATGHGEFFIRHAVAFDICARMRYLNLSVQEAASSVVHGTLEETGGKGGIIALDGDGNPALVFNTRAMWRGWIDSRGRAKTAIFETGP